MQAGTTPTTSTRSAREDDHVSTLPLYLHEMGSIPLLQPEEELELSKAIFDARQALIRIAERIPALHRDRFMAPVKDLSRELPTWPIDRLEQMFEQFDRYLEVGGTSSLQDLGRRAQPHRRALLRSREAMVVANLRLVVHIAKRFTNTGLTFQDLIQEGNLGLVKAVEKFDYRRGNRFSTYAFWWIKQSIDRAIADKARLIRLPVHLNEKRKQFSRAVKELRQSLDRRPTPDEVAAKLDMPYQKVQELLDIGNEPQSLDQMWDSPDGYDLLEVLEDPKAAQHTHEETENREEIEERRVGKSV